MYRPDAQEETDAMHQRRKLRRFLASLPSCVSEFMLKSYLYAHLFLTLATASNRYPNPLNARNSSGRCSATHDTLRVMLPETALPAPSAASGFQTVTPLTTSRLAAASSSASHRPLPPVLRVCCDKVEPPPLVRQQSSTLLYPAFRCGHI